MVTPLVLMESARQADKEALVTATVVRRQLENIFRSAENTTTVLLQMTGQPCEQNIGMLRRMGTLRPYFRSLVLVQDNRLTCSSVTGTIDDPLSDLLGSKKLAIGSQLILVASTPLVPDRMAVVLAIGLTPGTGALAIVDGQYIYDMQAAAAYDGLYNIDILIGQDETSPSSDSQIQSLLHSVQPTRQTSRSIQYPIEVHASVAESNLGTYSDGIWRNYLPFLLLASVLCGYVAHIFSSRQMSMVAEIRRGIRVGEFHMSYQPVVDLTTNQFSGVEALLRWNHPRYGAVGPDLFIPIAEEGGLLPELTRHVFDRVAEDLPLLGLTSVHHLAVNVSGSHIVQPRFIDDVAGFIQRLGAVPPTLVLEITERERLPDTPEVRDCFSQLRAHGVQWSLDDFGTGQSSLAYIEQFRPDFIKIDRAFTSGIGVDSINAVVLDSIIALGTRLNLPLVAEGIETPQQRDFLRDKSVRWGQGYLFSKPLPANALAVWRSQYTN
jgi:sensor c-di-GMP phosphodiesterase-like protein